VKNDHDRGNNVPTSEDAQGLSFKFKGPVGLVGGGGLDAATVEILRERVDFFVGADGGGDALLANGLIPEAVIGDLDSLSVTARRAIPPGRIHLVEEQDSTDFDKAVRSVDAPLILAAGFSGARLDHELAALHVLVCYPDRPVIVIGAQDLTVHVPARLVLRLTPGQRLSLFPLDGVRVRAEGLKWSFETLDLHPARRIGTSNAVLSGDVALFTDRPGLLLIVPREELDAVIVGLAEVEFHSPPG